VAVLEAAVAEPARAVELGTLLVVAAYAFTGLVSPLLGPRLARLSLYASTGVALAAAAYATLRIAPLGGYVVGFDGAVVVDTFAVYMLSTAVIVFALAAVAARGVVDRWEAGEAFYAVAGLMALGIIMLGLSRVLYLVYIAWILAAVSSYVLIALYRDDWSAEAAMKYAVTGAVATIVLLLGVILYYTVAGSLAISDRLLVRDPLLVTPVVTLLAVAVGFKMGVVPFHGWLVDVYGNARPLVVAIASAAAKVLAALLIVRLIAPFAAATPEIVLWVASVLAVITMTYGNVGALLTVRDSPQKMLAYSSVAQAGYILAAVAALAKLPGVDNQAAIAGIAIHTSAYVLSKLAAFLALDAGCRYPGCSWEQLRGLAWSRPYAAAALTVAAANLAGAPLTLGFWGKLYIVLAAVSASKLLAAAAVANIAVSAFYYGYLIYQLFLPRRGGGEWQVSTRELAAAAAALLTIVLALAPQQGYGLAVYAYTPAAPP